MNQLYSSFVDTPIGIVNVEASDQAIHAIRFVDKPNHSSPSNDMSEKAKGQLIEYFNGERQQFELPLECSGSDFQQQVWQKLENIPFGETKSYQDIAKTLSNPKAYRAVGSANGKNRIAIVIPCHRVIASNGKLAGYAYGEDKKAWLLSHEAKFSEMNFSS